MMLIQAAKYTAVMWEGIIWLGSSSHPLQKKPQPQIGISSTAVSILVSSLYSCSMCNATHLQQHKVFCLATAAITYTRSSHVTSSMCWERETDF